MNRKLIILDIDECLVYASEVQLDIACDFESDWCYVYKRPHVDEFIRFCQEHYYVAIWTSAGALHAELMVQNLFPAGFPFEFIYSVRNCTRRYDSEYFQEYYIKNFRKLKKKGYDLSQIIMIDDSPRKHMRNYGNLIRVSEFLGNQRDNELRDLMQYLMLIKDEPNIRTIEKRDWKIKISQFSNKLK